MEILQICLKLLILITPLVSIGLYGLIKVNKDLKK